MRGKKESAGIRLLRMRGTGSGRLDGSGTDQYWPVIYSHWYWQLKFCEISQNTIARSRKTFYDTCVVHRVAIRPALGRTVRFFKALSGVRRSIKRDAYLSSFWDTPTGHRSVVYYDNPFSSQLVIYRRFVTPLDVRYWRKRYPPASVWNDMGSHKPVCGCKRRAESHHSHW